MSRVLHALAVAYALPIPMTLVALLPHRIDSAADRRRAGSDSHKGDEDDCPPPHSEQT